MSRWAPCRRREFIRRLRVLGFEGPLSGARHQFLTHGHHRLAVPSNEEYSVSQLRMMLREVEQILGRKIQAEDWNEI
jgi:predicted RNA binding protein YcfA (HicA-like mRNA interferase family)